MEVQEAVNETLLRLAAEQPVQFPRPLTLFAAACAILFSVVGVLGKPILFLRFLVDRTSPRG